MLSFRLASLLWAGCGKEDDWLECVAGLNVFIMRESDKTLPQLMILHVLRQPQGQPGGLRAAVNIGHQDAVDGGDGEYGPQDGPGHDVGGVVLVVRDPADPGEHNVQDTQNLHSNRTHDQIRREK